MVPKTKDNYKRTSTGTVQEHQQAMQNVASSFEMPLQMSHHNHPAVSACVSQHSLEQRSISKAFGFNN